MNDLFNLTKTKIKGNFICSFKVFLKIHLNEAHN